jgi:hypothetical protein
MVFAMPIVFLRFLQCRVFGIGTFEQYFSVNTTFIIFMLQKAGHDGKCCCAVIMHFLVVYGYEHFKPVIIIEVHF